MASVPQSHWFTDSKSTDTKEIDLSDIAWVTKNDLDRFWRDRFSWQSTSMRVNTPFQYKVNYHDVLPLFATMLQGFETGNIENFRALMATRNFKSKKPAVKKTEAGEECKESAETSESTSTDEDYTYYGCNINKRNRFDVTALMYFMMLLLTADEKHLKLHKTSIIKMLELLIQHGKPIATKTPAVFAHMDHFGVQGGIKFDPETLGTALDILIPHKFYGPSISICMNTISSSLRNREDAHPNVFDNGIDDYGNNGSVRRNKIREAIDKVMTNGLIPAEPLFEICAPLFAGIYKEMGIPPMEFLDSVNGVNRLPTPLHAIIVQYLAESIEAFMTLPADNPDFGRKLVTFSKNCYTAIEARRKTESENPEMVKLAAKEAEQERSYAEKLAKLCNWPFDPKRDLGITEDLKPTPTLLLSAGGASAASSASAVSSTSAPHDSGSQAAASSSETSSKERQRFI